MVISISYKGLSGYNKCKLKKSISYERIRMVWATSFIDESSYELKFEDIICEDSNVKTLRQMKDLLYDKSIADEKDEVCYIYYFNIIRQRSDEI